MHGRLLHCVHMSIVHVVDVHFLERDAYRSAVCISIKTVNYQFSDNALYFIE